MFGAVEAFLILTLKALYDYQVTWPIMVVGIVAAILLAAGLLPPYFELWKRSGRVVGINFGFLTIDWLGAFFSFMGIVTQSTFDPLGGCLCIICIVIEGGIFVSHGIWLFRTRKLRAEAKAAGREFDELSESDVYHVEVARKGSIAASRNVERDEIARKGSLTLAGDLELGEGRKMSEILRMKDHIIEESILKTGVEVRVKEVQEGSNEGVVQVGDREGVQEVDYGTMQKSLGAPKTRPGFERRDTDQAIFKEPKW